MRNFNIPPEEDEDMFATSPIPYEQIAETTPVPDFMDQMPRVEQEMSNADQIQNETQELLSKISQRVPAQQEQGNLTEQDVERVSPKSVLDRYAELRQLQETQGKDIRNAGMLQGANQIAQGFAMGSGAKIGDGSESVKMLQQMAKQPVEDYNLRQKDEAIQMELGNEREMNDANSDISKFARERAVAFAIKTKMDPETIKKLEKMSAKQLEKLKLFNTEDSLKSRFQKAYTTNPKTGAVEIENYDTVTGTITPFSGRTVLSGYKPDVRKDEESKELLKIVANMPEPLVQQITGPNQNIKVDENNINKETDNKNQIESKKEDALKTPFEIKNLLDNGTYIELKKVKDEFTEETKEARRVVAGLDGTKKMLELAEKNPAGTPIAAAAITRLFEKGVLTDADVIRYVQRAGILDKGEDFLTKLTTGTFSKELVVQLAEVLDEYKNQQESQIQSISNQKAENAIGLVDPNTKINTKDISNMFYTPSVQKKSDKTVIDKGYNPKTNKTQTIYSDGSKETVDGKQ